MFVSRRRSLLLALVKWTAENVQRDCLVRLVLLKLYEVHVIATLARYRQRLHVFIHPIVGDLVGFIIRAAESFTAVAATAALSASPATVSTLSSLSMSMSNEQTRVEGHELIENGILSSVCDCIMAEFSKYLHFFHFLVIRFERRCDLRGNGGILDNDFGTLLGIVFSALFHLQCLQLCASIS